MLKIPDPQEMPTEILAIEGKKCIFHLRFNSLSKIRSVDFILDNVFGGPVEANGVTKELDDSSS